MIVAGKTITRNGCHLFLKHVLAYAFRNTSTYTKKYTTTCLLYDIPKTHLLNMMKCANDCTVTFATYLHLALLHSLHILHSLTEWENTEMAAPTRVL